MWVGLNTSDIFQMGFNPPSPPNHESANGVLIIHSVGSEDTCLAYSVYISSETLSSTLDIYFNKIDKNYLENRIQDTL